MEFLKRHYEKIALSVVLILLALVAVWLKTGIDKARQDLEASVTTLPKPVVFKPVDLTTNQTALDRLKNPPSVNLGSPHLVFSAVMWKQKGNGDLVKLQSANPADQLKVTKITPLKFIVAFSRVAGDGFYFSVTNQLKGKYPGRGEQSYLKIKDKNKYFTLLEIKGPAEDPAEFTIEMLDTKEKTAITKAKSFEKVEGYAADLRYELENKNFNDTRVNGMIIFGGVTNKVIAINPDEVRVQDISNQKQTTIKSKNEAKPAP